MTWLYIYLSVLCLRHQCEAKSLFVWHFVVHPCCKLTSELCWFFSSNQDVVDLGRWMQLNCNRVVQEKKTVKKNYKVQRVTGCWRLETTGVCVQTVSQSGLCGDQTVLVLIRWVIAVVVFPLVALRRHSAQTLHGDERSVGTRWRSWARHMLNLQLVCGTSLTGAAGHYSSLKITLSSSNKSNIQNICVQWAEHVKLKEH